MTEGLRGQVAILTGPPTPLSLTVARRLGNAGMKLVFAGAEVCTNSDLLRVANQFRHDALCIDANLNDVQQVQQVLEATERAFGCVDMMVHNLGSAHSEWTVARSMALVWNGNALQTALACSSAAIRHMAERRHGHVVHLVTRDDVGALEVEKLVLTRLQQAWPREALPPSLLMSTVYFEQIAPLLPRASPWAERREERVMESFMARAIEEDDWAARVTLEEQIGDLMLQVCTHSMTAPGAVQSFDFYGGRPAMAA